MRERRHIRSMRTAVEAGAETVRDGARSTAAGGRLLADRTVRYLAAVGATAETARTVVLGRWTGLSLAIVALSLVKAGSLSVRVWTTVGYLRVEDWVLGTWTGADPHGFVIAAGLGLLALAAISAALDSGLVPTGLLVTAPVFGVAVTRYGTRWDPVPGSELVSLPDAVAFGLGVALLVGLPIAVVGFLLGAGSRRAIRPH